MPERSATALARAAASDVDRFAPLPDGRRTCYRVDDPSGEPDTPTVVLVAGLGEDLTQWAPELVTALTAGGLRVVRLDNRDCGRSSYVRSPAPATWRQALGRPRPDGYTLADMAEDVMALLDHLEVPAAHLLGRSMGGMIAQTVAARHPDRVLSLTSLYSTTGAPDVGGYTLGTMLRLAAPPPRSREAAVRAHVAMARHLAGSSHPVDEAREAAAAETTWRRTDGDAADGTARQVQAIQRSGDRTAELRRIAAPTLVVHGDRDPLVAPSGGRATAAAIPGARFVEVPGMGHHLHHDLVPLVADLVLDLVAGAPTEPATRPAPTRQESPVPSGFHTFSASRVLPAPVQVVWDVSGDPRRNPEWVGNVRAVHQSSGAYVVGESFAETSTVVGPWSSRTVWTVVGIDPLRERRLVGQGFPGIGEIRPFLRYEPVTAADGSEHCRMTYGAALSLRWPRSRPVALRLLRPMLVAEFGGSLEALEPLVVAAGVRRD